MNLPNKLTVSRMVMIPLFLFFMIFPNICGFTLSRLIATVLFGLTAFTDMLDGKIARKYNLVTDFGKFLDPLADKLMIFGAMVGVLALTYQNALKVEADVSKNYLVFCQVFAFATFLIMFRELAVTSLRMIVSGAGIVVPANIFGKLKTVSQISGMIMIILEPIVWDGFLVSYVFVGLMIFTTVFSGLTYFKAYLPYLDSNK